MRSALQIQISCCPIGLASQSNCVFAQTKLVTCFLSTMMSLTAVLAFSHCTCLFPPKAIASHHCNSFCNIAEPGHACAQEQAAQLHLLHQKPSICLVKLHHMRMSWSSCSATWQQLSRLELRRSKTSNPWICLVFWGLPMANACL